MAFSLLFTNLKIQDHGPDVQAARLEGDERQGLQGDCQLRLNLVRSYLSDYCKICIFTAVSNPDVVSFNLFSLKTGSEYQGILVGSGLG